MAEIDFISSCTIGSDQSNCFEKLSREEMDTFTKNMVEVRYGKGEVICKQGTFATHIMVLMDGLVKVYLEGGNQEKLILKILPAVNLIGLPCLFEGNNLFQYSAQAYIDSKVRLIEMNTFKELLKNNADFSSRIISTLAENTIITYGRFFCLTKKQSYGRLADILLCLSQRIYKQDAFPLQLSRKELAELASLSVESVARILTSFKEDNLIKVTNESIKILDFERLSAISQNG